MNLAEFNLKTFNPQDEYPCKPLIICNDGFQFSVQGSKIHYCEPRKNQYWYSEMEIGFPNQEEELIKSYAENESDLTQTVYGYVPCELIQQVIDKHQGINIELTFAD
jgi:hypothetical protein